MYEARAFTMSQAGRWRLHGITFMLLAKDERMRYSHWRDLCSRSWGEGPYQCFLAGEDSPFLACGQRARDRPVAQHCSEQRTDEQRQEKGRAEAL